MPTTEPAHASEGDERDAIADQRDIDADLRDAVAAERDSVADAREAELRMWEQQLEARARRLWLATGEALSPATFADAAAERDAAATERAARASERDDAAAAREASAARRAEARRDTLLAGAFAGIAGYLHESRGVARKGRRGCGRHDRGRLSCNRHARDARGVGQRRSGLGHDLLRPAGVVDVVHPGRT